MLNLDEEKKEEIQVIPVSEPPMEEFIPLHKEEP